MLMRNMLKKIIIKLGYQVCAEAGGIDEALTKYDETNPDIVFLDLILDDEEEPAGLTILDELLCRNKELKIVIVSALKQEKITEKALELGAFTYINKPFNEQKISQVFQSLNN